MRRLLCRLLGHKVIQVLVMVNPGWGRPVPYCTRCKEYV